VPGDKELEMKASRAAFVAALSAFSVVAFAGPTQVGVGPGTYSWLDDHDSAWYVTLAPGTYDVTSAVVSDGFTLTNVWFSTTKSHKSVPGEGEIALFDMISTNHFDGSLDRYTVTAPTRLYVDINTDLGKLSGGAFIGTVTVTSVPEPASMALLAAGVGLLGLIGVRRRRRG
jgi:hypothetical protein